MASRHQLASRPRTSETSSPAPRRARDGEPAGAQPVPLPPYEPPSFPLTVSQQHALDNLRINYDYTKYKKHLTESKKNITNAIGESNDRFTAHRDKVRRIDERVRQKERERTEAELEEEKYTKMMEKKVGELTTKGEKAMRDLIDYSDELAMQETIISQVSDNVTVQPAAPPASRRNENEGDNVDEADEAPAADVAILSPVELLKQAREDYIKTYTSKSMRDRYTNNDYKGFKQTVHDAMHPEDDAPPVPHASTWFPDDGRVSSRSKRLGGGGENAKSESEEDDDDVIIASATTNLKCPLTLQLFVEPYSNNVCKHSFEKEAIISYHRDNAVAFIQASQRRGPRPQGQGPRQVNCPALGCDAMLELDDFYEDQLLLRQVKRAQRTAALEMEEDDQDAEVGNRRAGSGGFDEGDTVDHERKRTIAEVKREQGGPAVDRKHPKSEVEDEDEPMNTPESDG